MPQDINLPINEPGLQGIAAPVEVGDPTGWIGADGEPQHMQRRLWFLYPLIALGTSAISGGVNLTLIPSLVATFPGGDKVGAAAIVGLALSVSGFTYLIGGPVGGILSDRTRTRFLGRRNLWVLIGAILSALALVALGTSTNETSLVIFASIATIPLSVTLAAAIAVVPDRVPLRQRGRISSLNGMIGLVGSGVGITVASLTATPFLGCVVLAVAVVVLCAAFAFGTKDTPAPARETKEERSRADRPKFPTPRSHPDYWLTFAARGLAFLAYGLATGLELFALRDYFHVGDTAAARLAVAQLTGPSIGALALAAILGGILVDRFGRIKPFVFIASFLFIPAAIVLATVPTMTGALIGFTLNGLAFGAYISVDGVLMTRVIPSKTNAGRDLGFLNVSGSVGSIIAPALAGAIVATTGYSFVFLLVIVAGAIASAAVLFIRSVK